MAALIEGQQQDLGRRDTGWSFLAEAMKMFGPTEITQELSKKFLNNNTAANALSSLRAGAINSTVTPVWK